LRTVKAKIENPADKMGKFRKQVLGNSAVTDTIKLHITCGIFHGKGRI
jgi:hypothetical protein